MSKISPFQNIRRAIGTIFFLLIGPVLWALHLTFIYGPQSALCAQGYGTDTEGQNMSVVTIVAIVTLVAAFANILALLFPLPTYRIFVGSTAPAEQWPFLQGVSRLLVGLSVLAILYAGAAVLFLPACAQLR